MKSSIAFVAFAALAAAQDTSFNPAAATASLVEALPASLQAIAVTNSEAVASVLESDFLAGSTPGWFASLPTAVQSYFISQGEAALGTTTGSAGATATSGSSMATSTTTAASSASAKSSTGAAVPTAVLGSGLVGVVGILGALAL